MSNATSASRSLLHRLGVAAPARTRAFPGSALSAPLIPARENGVFLGVWGVKAARKAGKR